ncbi:BMC domain-containing protein [Clostridium beijerinckii]|uniref:BMC domain-containing protein n=1 Tax=Clostridium beijerinckii TaxID=1520 RepID=UPI00156FCDC3|nr:BMC domain-containing protein [Clostridium beijerinckii]NRU37479.1 microcompartment protein CcmL/EutN [Clostridium beijerinckii]
MKEALGLVETIGLSTAILAEDAMAKTANVNIIDLENTKGSGYMTIKVSGDVGAVTAAVTAGRQVATENNAFVSSKVIPRPSNNIESAFCQPKKEEDTSSITENNIIEESNVSEENNIIEGNNTVENKEYLENPVVVLEEALTEKVEKQEDKQEENTSQSEGAVVENNEDINQPEEDGIQLKQSDIEISQSQPEEKRTRKTSSRKKGK